MLLNTSNYLRIKFLCVIWQYMEQVVLGVK